MGVALIQEVGDIRPNVSHYQTPQAAACALACDEVGHRVTFVRLSPGREGQLYEDMTQAEFVGWATREES